MKNKYDTKKPIHTRKTKFPRKMTYEELLDEVMVLKEEAISKDKYISKIDDSFEKLGDEYLRVCDLYNQRIRCAFTVREEKIKNQYLEKVIKGGKQITNQYTKMIFELRSEVADKDALIEHEKRKSALYFKKLDIAIQELEGIKRFTPFSH